MNPNPWLEDTDAEPLDLDPRFDDIPRTETLIRLALTLLFAIVAGAILLAVATAAREEREESPAPEG